MSEVWPLQTLVEVGVNSKCGVQSKRRCESHESCICIVGFPAYGCQKKSVVYETECRHAAVPPLLILGGKHRERKREIKLYFSTVKYNYYHKGRLTYLPLLQYY